MVGSYSKKRKVQDGMQGKTSRPKKFRRQREYHSGSEDEQDDDGTFKPVNLGDSDEEGGVSVNSIPVAPRLPKKTTKATPAPKQKPVADEKDSSDKDDNDAEDDEADEEDLDASGSEENDDLSDDEQSTTGGKRRPIAKRNDPTAFSTSISKILSTKLPASARADPVLSRSRYAAQTSSEWENEKLDNQARAKMRAEKKEELDRGRVRDVMGIERGLTGQVGEEEKRLRKTAQRGVVKLFNAVRAAQVRGEEAAKDERKKGTVGMGEREKAVNEVSKQGFLELINGKKGKPLNIEEA
ncbi:pre-60S ribosomal particles component [Penicillium ochrochloron]